VASRPEWLDTNAEGDQSFFIGQMDDADHRLLGFFYTRVADGGDVRRKRVGLRKLISPYLKYDVDGAIAVFDDGRYWRLSYICDLKEGSTSAKRFSYILGDENGQYKTPLERLEKVAKLNGRLKLSDLRESFSVDALSDEFFDEYHLHYDRIVANLTQVYRRDVPWRVSTDGTSDTRLHDYVKKMMGRIVFLHFLQKKGWLNGNPTFLRDLFLSSPYQSDFLEQVLEPLFFGIFNTESEQRVKLFANEHWDKGLLKQWEHLPYLNGGLFERDEVDKMNIRLPASLFNNLFTFLASYNFTVDENDPDDAEIGVDPEMLGKIFESLLEDNKAKGAFYTPKEIVRYMCKESLIAYLSEQLSVNSEQNKNTKIPTDIDSQITDHSSLITKIRTFVETHEFPDELEPYRDVLNRALREVKICDPAIGSGAFPMGLLNELWRCREALTDHDSCSLITVHRSQLKKEIIENNIYGVDIERGAIDIARLRFWLSIVVDSDEPEPLPNFDYKFMQGNSLIESFEGVDLSRMMSSEGQHSSLGKGRQKAGANQLGIEFVSTDTKRNLQLMLREYFSLTDHVKKAEARREINDSVKNYIRHQDLRPEAVARLASLDPSANQEFFLWHTWFKDIFDGGGFDIVIGNPPYIKYEGAIKGEIETIRKISELEIAFGGKLNAYKLFLAVSINKICKERGVISMIFQNSFIADQQATLLRKEVINHHRIITIDSFPERDSKKKRVFPSVKMSVCILLMQKAGKQMPFVVNFWNDKYKSSGTNVIYTAQDIKNIDSKDYCIPRIEQHSIPLAIKLRQFSKIPLKCYEGELNMTFHKHFFNDDSTNPAILKGAAIQRYYITYKMSQGKIEYLDEDWYLSENTSEKSRHHEVERIAMQGMTGANDKIRLVMTIVPSGVYLANSCNYILPTKELPASYLLGLLNSKLLNWYFRCFSTNSNVNGYEVEDFPMPKANEDQKQTIIALVDQILAVKKTNPNTDTSDLEREIDGLVYEMYNLSSDNISIIEESESFDKCPKNIL
jgi:Alw26I/Eco31I/Esp3I family type II restriction m6 adenine DNA methyltransferase